MFWCIKKFHKVYARSYRAGLLMGLSGLALAFSAPAHCQTVFIENGGGNLAGYDPSSGISVLTGQTNVLSAGMQNAQNAQNAYKAATENTNTNSGSETQTPTAAPKTPIGESTAAKEYGFGLLGSGSSNDVVSGAQSSSKEAKDSNPSVRSDGQPISDDDIEMRKRAEAMLKNAQKNSGVLTPATEAKPPVQQTQQATQPFQTIRGRATALDAITLRVNGTIAVLDGLQAPGNDVMCYSGTFPWPCGAKGREELSKLVSGLNVTCRVRAADSKAACVTEDGDDLAQMVGRRGFALSTNAITADAVNVARHDSRGIFKQ